MTSKFRPLAILFSLGMLIGFGLICYILDLKVTYIESPKNATVIAIIITNLMVFGGLVALILIPKTIHIDQENLIVNYLFRPKRLEYKIKDFQGFNWDYLYAAINYKQIVLYNKNGIKIKFSDYEYGNFYDLEDYIKKHIPVFKSLTTIPTDEEVKQAFQYSDYLDLQQIMQIKIGIYIAWGSTIILLIANLDHLHNFSVITSFMGILWILFVSWTIRKYKQENIRKKKILSSA
jgi:hypothetical protein